MKDHLELKRLQTQLKNETLELELVEREVSDINDKISKHKSAIKKLQKSINSLTVKPKNVVVSEHAILRYLERFKGVNIDEIKQEILTEETKEVIIQLGGKGKFPVNKNGGTNHKLIVENYVIKSVY